MLVPKRGEVKHDLSDSGRVNTYARNRLGTTDPDNCLCSTAGWLYRAIAS